MSKLGKVYVINIKGRRKEIHPVVYMNQDYIYCKTYGTSMLDWYRRDNVLSYEQFKESYEQEKIDNSRTYIVYVPASVKTFFEWITEQHPIEIEIEKLQKTLSQYDNHIRCLEDDIKRYTTSIEIERSKRSQALKNLEALQLKLDEMRCTHESI